MARYYSRKSDSSGSISRNSRKNSSTSRRSVDYDQSATTDLSRPAKGDVRARYANYKKRDQSIRVLPTDGNSRFADQRRRPTGFAGEDFSDSSDDVQRRWLREQKGVTIREHKISQSNSGKDKANILRRVFVIVAVLLTLVALMAIVYFTPAFTIKNIAVEGNTHLYDKYVQELSGDMSGTTLLRMNTKELKAKLLSDPWIADVQIKRSFPSTLTLVITERKIIASAEITSLNQTEKTYWLLASDGIWLTDLDISQLEAPSANSDGQASGANQEQTQSEDGTSSGSGEESAEEPAAAAPRNPQAQTQAEEPSLLDYAQITASQIAAMPRIREVSANANPQIGTVVSDEGVLNALEVINGVSPELLAQIRFISAPDRVKTSLTLTNNVEIAIGVAEDIPTKEQVILALLKEHEGRIVYINVRVVDRPTYRSA